MLVVYWWSCWAVALDGDGDGDDDDTLEDGAEEISIWRAFLAAVDLGAPVERRLRSFR